MSVISNDPQEYSSPDSLHIVFVQLFCHMLMILHEMMQYAILVRQKTVLTRLSRSDNNNSFSFE